VLTSSAYSHRYDERYPLVLLLCDSNPFSIVRWFEHALYDSVNVISVYLDVHEWFVKKFSLPSLLYKLMKTRLSHVKPMPSEPDVVLLVEPPIKLHYDLSSFKNSLKVFYALDPHGDGAIEGYKKCRVDEYDVVFVAQKDYLHTFKEIGCEKVYWLPYAYDPRIFREIKNVPMRYDVAFIGSMNEERRTILEKVRQKFKLFVTEAGMFAFMHDASLAYSMSKAALQISNRKTLGPRIFEAMGCRRMVLADSIKNGLEEIFTEDENIVLYSDTNELLEKLEFYLHDKEERGKDC